MEVNKIKIDKRIYNKCVKFAEDRIVGSKSLYSYRGETSSSKMVTDIIIGTLAEWGVYKHLSSLGRECTKPDMKIYEKRRKSFDADLTSGKYAIHVKGQGTASQKRYGNSWLFQRYDKLVSEPKETDILAFTCVDLESRTVEIVGYCYAAAISEFSQWGECKVPRYRHTKVALYVDDLGELIGDDF